MKLVESLAAGVNGAAGGSAILMQRGTSTPVIYYRDFEASQPIQSTLAGVALDANGGGVFYVNQFVDVKVLDVNGVQLREFVAGDEAPAVEVISRSFTGTSYSDGTSGASKPTNLQVVLDAWFASAGALDFNVAVNGVSTTMIAAVAGLAGLFFNVKSYGAIGDGVADDGASITAAMAAAGLVGGGIVFFPPGTYRTTTTLSIPVNVNWMGCGCAASRIAINNGAMPTVVSIAHGSTVPTRISGMRFGALSAYIVPYMVIGGASTCVTIEDCQFGGDAVMTGQHINITATGQSSRVVIERSLFSQAGINSMVAGGTTGRTVIRDCDFVVTSTTYASAVLGFTDGLSVHDCRFDASAVTVGVPQFIQFAPSSWGGCVFTGNRFKASATVPICLFNALAAPLFDCSEYGNSFGDNVNGFNAIVPYAYTTDGYAAQASFQGAICHGSRIGRVQNFVGTNGATVTFSPKAYGEGVIHCTAGPGGVTMNGDKGASGDRWLVTVTNTSGGNIVVTPDGNFVLDAAAATFTVANTTTQILEFVWVPNLAGTGAQWHQVNKPAIT